MRYKYIFFWLVERIVDERFVVFLIVGLVVWDVMIRSVRKWFWCLFGFVYNDLVRMILGVGFFLYEELF